VVRRLQLWLRGRVQSVGTQLLATYGLPATARYRYSRPNCYPKLSRPPIRWPPRLARSVLRTSPLVQLVDVCIQPPYTVA